MSEPLPCPYCGARPAQGGPGRDGASTRAMTSLVSELRRLREAVESRERQADSRRIDELDREVRQLRETVARLRGSAASVSGYR